MQKTNASTGNPTGPDNILTVGVGASAGGLKAFGTFLEALGDEPESAVVYLTHHEGDDGTRLRDLLTRHTKLPVRVIQDGVKLARNTVFVGPPGSDVTLFHGRFRLVPPSDEGRHVHIDTFLRSLATDQEHYAAGVLLSGAGDDGVEGIRAIHAAAGLTLAQDPATAEYDTMPAAALASGVVDKVLPPDQLAEAVREYARHVSKRRPVPGQPSPAEEEEIDDVLALLNSQVGHDFSPYKRSTVYRRVVRRMGLHQIDSISSYTQYLRSRPREAEFLFKDLLIGVTSFFRESNAFETLRTVAFPRLFADGEEQEYRFWVPGCATGEEAYSLAILTEEYRREHELDFSVQIFATDVNEAAIEVARRGRYPQSIRRDVGEERLSQFFEEVDDAFQVTDRIRNMVLFAKQDILRDPPFANIDLLSCRNLLIYLEPATQRRLLPVLAYSLTRRGILFLGSSENVGARSEHFKALSKEQKVFFRSPEIPVGLGRSPGFGRLVHQGEARRLPTGIEEQTVKRQIEVYLLAHHTPPAVFVNRKAEVVYIHGKTGRFLEPQSGYARMDVNEMAREGLDVQLSHALREARRLEARKEQPSIRFESEGSTIVLDLIVEPMEELAGDLDLYAILFCERSAGELDAAPTDHAASAQSDSYVRGLEEELRATKERLHTTIEELETTNEELKSSLEEYQSTNEELASANQELQSEKARAQSANEELERTSGELQEKNKSLEKAGAEAARLLENTGLPVLVVDREFLIQQFTTAVQDLVNVIESDVGRDVRQLTTTLATNELPAVLNQVLQNRERQDSVVETTDGRSFLLRAIPHCDVDGTNLGVVATFLEQDGT
ncbi:MAG: chemotaxis protein CheR [Spirochaetes bacterium]|jgi:two-component system CheB/CheR fusion protein|nr:chemotaxis protein CheR [Spirochaetota bacterium]